MICPRCTQKVSALSNRCPYCTTEFETSDLWKFNFKIFLWAVIFIIILLAVFS